MASPVPPERAPAPDRPAGVAPATFAPLRDRPPGRPLPTSVRASMELALGVDLGAVRVHTDPAAHEAAARQRARAFTEGTDLYFAAGEFAPESAGGLDLLTRALAGLLAPDVDEPAAPPPDPQAEDVVRPPPAPAPQLPALNEPAPPPPVEPGPPGPAAGGPPPEAEVAEGVAPVEEAPPEEEPSVPSPPAEAPGVDLLMPPPPAELSPAARARGARARRAADTAGETASELPTAETSTAQARSAVEEPDPETTARAELRLTEALGKRAEPSSQIEQLCKVIRKAIRDKRPVDEDDLVKAEPEAMANQAGRELDGAVEGDSGRVQQSYQALEEPQEGVPELDPQDIEHPPERVDLPELEADAAAPDAVPAGDVSLDADLERVDERLEAAGMNTEPAQLARDGPVADARAGRGELASVAEAGPAAALAAQDAALSAARADLATLQLRAVEALEGSRAGTVTGVAGQQDRMVETEEQTRERISGEARAIFTEVQSQVRTLLDPLPREAMKLWREGIKRRAAEFRRVLNEVREWIEERHSGVGGAIVAGWDWLTGLPRWVTRTYDRAEQKFGDDVCELIREISATVNSVVAACEALIDEAREKIDRLFTDLPEGLVEWAAQERTRIQSQLDGLQQEVTDTRDNFDRDLSRRAVEAVSEVQAEIAQLREEAKGLIGRVADAIAEFVDDPIRAIINGLLRLVNIPPPSFWSLVEKIRQAISDIADDPRRFVNNLVQAVGRGFSQFFGRIGRHLLEGVLDWLFSGLGAVGVALPRDLSPRSIITFFLQLMGISWPRIRQILVRHVGEDNVALIERAWQLVATLAEQGPEGIFDLLEERLDPSRILSQVLDAIVDYVTDAVIRNVMARVLALFNPVGAIVQAIELVYRVCKWIFQNAARLFTFVETIVNGIVDIIRGNIGGMANAVEQALAKLIPPVIDFLAGMAHIGDLPDRVVATVQGLQDWVASILDRVVAWLVEQGRALLRAVGLGGEEEAAEGPADVEATVGTTVPFSAAGELHRQWIDVEGTDATLMVASSGPQSVEALLADWEARLDAEFAGDDDARTEAATLLPKARTLATQADVEADAILHAIAKAAAASSAGGEPDVPSAEAVEAKQHDLTAVLSRLLELYAPGLPFEPIARTAKPLHGGGEEPLLVEAGGDRLTVSIAGQPGAGALAAVLAGPLAAPDVKNLAGKNLVTEIFNLANALVTHLEGVPLRANTIRAPVHADLVERIEALTAAVAGLGEPMRIKALERATRIASARRQETTFLLPETVREHNQAYQDLFVREFRRQLELQQEGLNAFTIDQWAFHLHMYRLDEDNLKELDKSVREAVLAEINRRAQEAAVRARGRRQLYLQALAETEKASPEWGLFAIVGGRYGDERQWRRAQSRKGGIKSLRELLIKENAAWSELAATLGDLAVLHNADQVAGGVGTIPPVEPPPTKDDLESWEEYLKKLRPLIGASKVNSSIGAQWRTRIDGPDGLYPRITREYPEPGWPIWRLCVVLRAEERP